MKNRHVYEISSEGSTREVDLLPQCDLTDIESIRQAVNSQCALLGEIRFRQYNAREYDGPNFTKGRGVLKYTDLHLHRPYARFVLKIGFEVGPYPYWISVRKLIPETADWRKIHTKYKDLIQGDWG